MTVFCLNCKAETITNEGEDNCSNCNSKWVLLRGTVLGDRAARFLGVHPRRVEVTREQASDITLAYRDIEIERRSLELVKQRLAVAEAKLASVMAEING